MVKLYFSVKPEYRKNGVWMMNDETALTLRTLKDADGNYVAGALTNGKAEVGGLFHLEDDSSIRLFGIKLTNNNDIQTATVEGYSGGVIQPS